MGVESVLCQNLVTQEKGREILRSGGMQNLTRPERNPSKSFSPDCYSSVRVVIILKRLLSLCAHKTLHRSCGLSHIFHCTAVSSPLLHSGCCLCLQLPGLITPQNLSFLITKYYPLRKPFCILTHRMTSWIHLYTNVLKLFLSDNYISFYIF